MPPLVHLQAGFPQCHSHFFSVATTHSASTEHSLRGSTIETEDREEVSAGSADFGINFHMPCGCIQRIDKPIYAGATTVNCICWKQQLIPAAAAAAPAAAAVDAALFLLCRRPPPRLQCMQTGVWECEDKLFKPDFHLARFQVMPVCCFACMNAYLHEFQQAFKMTLDCSHGAFVWGL